MYLSETHEKKWQPVLEHPDLPEIKDSYRQRYISYLGKPRKKLQKKTKAFLNEACAYKRNWFIYCKLGSNPNFISKKSMPNLIAYDIAGVQPMTGPTGLIFAMRSRYTSQTGNEAMFDEADTDFSGRNAAGSSVDGYSSTAHSGTNNNQVY